MIKFKVLLWYITKLLQREIKKNRKCAEYIKSKNLIFQIQTKNGNGRYFQIKDGEISSHSGLTSSASFTFTFKTANTGFTVLSAKDSVNVFLRALHNQDLVIKGNYIDVMWFQGLVDFIQPQPSKECSTI